jgi:hypothetical protein
MLLKKTVATIVSGVILLAWGFVSWTVLPWHQMVTNEFTDEAEVAEVIKENAPKAGVYYLPFAHRDQKAGETAAVVNALPRGYDPGMIKQLVTQFIGNLISALIVICLLSQTAGLGYWGRVGFVALVGVAIGFVSHFPYWNWFGFPTPHVVVTVIDSLIAWFLAGLAIAKLVAKNTKKITSSGVSRYG